MASITTHLHIYILILKPSLKPSSFICKLAKKKFHANNHHPIQNDRLHCNLIEWNGKNSVAIKISRVQISCLRLKDKREWNRNNNKKNTTKTIKRYINSTLAFHHFYFCRKKCNEMNRRTEFKKKCTKRIWAQINMQWHEKPLRT